MQFKQTLLRAVFIFSPFIAFSQASPLQQGDKQHILLERLEIKGQTDSVLNFSKNRYFNRQKYILNGVQSYIDKNGTSSLSKVDRYNLNSLYLNNLEFATPEDRVKYSSKKPILKHFYKTPANLLEVHEKDFDLIVNPILNLGFIKENDNSQQLFQNTRGIAVRGKIADKIGFYTTLTENQERLPSYVQEWVTERQAVPGQGFYKNFKDAGGVDYFDARGGITFGATKYIDLTFAYDKNFIGNGYRSLILSEGSNAGLFLKLNTRIWKFNYQNIFMELQTSQRRGGRDKLIPKKYAAIHHLDFAATKWLNIGIFEAVTFGRENRFDFSYLVPVIFYRSIEQQNGSPDNMQVGMDFKANIARTAQIYGQFNLNEFKLSEIKASNGWWANKWGLQLGAKYIDAFGIKNLDLQAEYNYVRPFTYSHRDSIADYTHYNQPLAHPLGANFKEVIGIARYQPAPKWTIEGKLIAYQQGRDSSAANYGSNIFLDYGSRTDDYGWKVGRGWKTNVLMASLAVSYELRENLFLELIANARKLNTKTAPIVTEKVTTGSIGLRWNIFRRTVDY